jgi:hypothetical protein
VESQLRKSGDFITAKSNWYILPCPAYHPSSSQIHCPNNSQTTLSLIHVAFPHLNLSSPIVDTPNFNLSFKLSIKDGDLNISDRDTIVTLAMMPNAAYTRGHMNPIGNLTVVEPVGWNTPGVRGYVFGANDKSLSVIVYKGTSISIPGVPSDVIPTNANDKMTVLSV